MLRRGILVLCVLLCGGWTHSVATTYYVNASTGNDGNSGLSPAQAWQTIGKINGATLAAGRDTINLQGSFSDACLTISPTNAGSVSSLVIQPYGAGYTITANCSGNRAAAVTINGVSNVTIKNGTVTGNTGVAQYGILVENVSTQTIMTNTTIQNMVVSGFYCLSGPSCTGSTADNYGSEIIVRRFADSDGAISGVSILNNTLGGSVASSPDDNGVVIDNMSNETANVNPGGAVAFTQSRLAGVTINNNLIRFIGGKTGANGGLLTGNGILTNAVGSGTIKQNVIHDNGGNTNTCGGNAGVVLAVYTNAFTVANNSVYNQQPISFSSGCDWDAYDIDVGGVNDLVEYNYAYNTLGVCLFASFGNGNIFRYNVCEKNGLGSSVTNFSVWTSNNFVSNVDFYNNTIYANIQTAVALDDPGTTTGIFANNIIYGNFNNEIMFHTGSANGASITGITVINNDYFNVGPGGFRATWNGTTYTSMGAWQAAGGDADGITTNPSLTNPGNAGACTTAAIPNTCPAAYVLSGGSAMIGAGLNLTTGPYNRVIGSTDFYGNALPNGVSTGYNFGADGGNP